MASGKDVVNCMKCGAVNWEWNKNCWKCGDEMDSETQEAVKDNGRHR